MARLLIVDDDPAQLGVLSDYLRREDHEVLIADSGAAGLELARSARPDLVVLDVAMPEMDGLEVLRRLRPESDVPVIILTALAGEPDVLRGFSLGADDYVAKPFSLPELAARVRAILARSSRPEESQSTLARGGLVVDLGKHRVRRHDDWIKLTPTEFRLLIALMEQPGRVMSPEDLVTRVWGAEYTGQADYVRRYVWYLRQKLEDDPEAPAFIQNERSVGYYFAEPASGPDEAVLGDDARQEA